MVHHGDYDSTEIRRFGRLYLSTIEVTYYFIICTKVHTFCSCIHDHEKLPYENDYQINGVEVDSMRMFTVTIFVIS